MTSTNSSSDTIERRDKRVWSKYNPSPVKRIDILMVHRSSIPGRMMVGGK
jgi:hypothetical protein